jgi:hypothetical protein
MNNLTRDAKIQLLKDVSSGKKTINDLKPAYEPSLPEMKKYVQLIRENPERECSNDDDSIFLLEFEQKCSGGISLEHLSREEFLIEIMGGKYKKACDSEFVTCHIKNCKCEPIIYLPDNPFRN